MHKDSRRQIRFSNTQNILSELVILDPSLLSSTERDRRDYIGAMASELSKMALRAEDGFLGYLLDLAAKEARANRVGSRRHVSTA